MPIVEFLPTASIALCALVMLASGPALGEVFRCDENGKVVYSDRPCGKQRKPVFGSKAKPPPVEIGSSAPSKAPAPNPNVESPSDGRLQPVLTREASAQLTRCVAESFNRWYLAQDPKPGREVEQAQLKTFDQTCRKQLDLPAEAHKR
ncbi:MAG TPA: DUF4124 domain-containing protein [Casimicrobiaceae bacterium]|nr:DUF4124 domain-containing protein [Casimicrobiaceae bacterium]